MISTKFIRCGYFQFIKKGHVSIVQKMHFNMWRLPQFLKTHSVGIVTNCVRNCEYLMAYKLRRGQQVFSLYTRLWGEARLKEILRQIRRKVIQQLAQKNRTIMLSGGLVLFDWKQNRITEKTIKEHYVDLEYAKYLIQKTLTCNICQKRLVVDKPCANVQYCTCPDSKKVLAKKFESGSWVPFMECPDLLIWRREKDQHPGLYEYKLFGVYDEVRADIFLKVQIDTEFRTKWDSTAIDIRVVDVDPITNSEILYWEMEWPRFFANRDYVYNRRYVVDPDKKVIVIYSQTANHPGVPENPDKFRVKEYYCTMVIKPLSNFDKPGLEFCMTYFDDPGLSIPPLLQTYVASKVTPRFLERLREASVKYDPTDVIPEWMSELNVRGSSVFDDFSTVHLVEKSPLIEELPAITSVQDSSKFPS